MNKLITYLKEGKGRGLKATLIFSVFSTLLLWWSSFSVLKSLPNNYPNISESSLPMIHLAFIFASFILIWLLYLIIVGISAFFSWAFRLKLSKGAVWRTTTFSMITFFLISILTSLIGSFLLFIIGAILPLSMAPVNTVILSVFSPIVYLIVFLVLLITLILFGIRGPKEKKKK